uniref:Sm protein E n=1 Tax=Leersia perrieri TaxID=77586 RepID=A0A0D9X4E6_9ORYZ
MEVPPAASREEEDPKSSTEKSLGAPMIPPPKKRKKTDQEESASASSGTSTLVSRPLPPRYPSYPSSQPGERVTKKQHRHSIHQWIKENSRINKLYQQEKDIPTLRDKPRDPLTADSVVSSQDKAMVLRVARSVVTVSSKMPDGEELYQCSGILSVRMPNKTITDGRLAQEGRWLTMMLEEYLLSLRWGYLQGISLKADLKVEVHNLVDSYRESITFPVQFSDSSNAKACIQIWLFEQKDLRIEGRIIGFDEYMNLVLDDAEEINVKKDTRKSLGRIQLKGDNITLMMNTGK